MEPPNDGDKDTAQSATSDTTLVENTVSNTEDKGEETTESPSGGDNKVASTGKFTYAAALKSDADNSGSSTSPLEKRFSGTKTLKKAVASPGPSKELYDSAGADTENKKPSVLETPKGAKGLLSTPPGTSVDDLNKEFSLFDERMDNLTGSITSLKYGVGDGQLYSQTLFMQTTDALGAFYENAPTAISKAKRQRKSCSNGCPFELLTDAFYKRLSTTLSLLHTVSEHATELSEQALHDRPQSTRASATNSPEADKDHIIQKLRHELLSLQLDSELGAKSTLREKAESGTQGSSPPDIWEAPNTSSPRNEPMSPILESIETPNISPPRNKLTSPNLESIETPDISPPKNKPISPILESPKAPTQETKENWSFQETKKDKPTFGAKDKRTLLPAVDIVPNVAFEAKVPGSDSEPEADRKRKPGTGPDPKPKPGPRDKSSSEPTGHEEDDTRSYLDRTLPLSSLWDREYVPSPPRTPVPGERRGWRRRRAPSSQDDHVRQNMLPAHYSYWLRRVESPQLESPDHRRPHEKDNKHGLYSDGQNAWYCLDEGGWTEIRQFRSPILVSYVLLLHAVSTRMESVSAHTKDYVAFLYASELMVRIPIIALCCSLRDLLVWSYCSLRDLLVWSYCSLRDCLFWFYCRCRDFLVELYCRLRYFIVAGSRRASCIGLWAGQKALTCLKSLALAPFRILSYTISLIDQMVVIHNMLRVSRIIMFLHTLQVYVAVKRERDMWSEANNTSQVHMLRWLSREPTFWMPGIDYSRALGWVDITTATMIGLQALETSLGAGDVAAEYVKGTVASAVASSSELFQTMRKSAWVESASFTTIFIWRLLVYWAIDSFTLPAQYAWFLDAEMDEVVKWVMSCAAGGVGMFVGWLLFIRDNPATGVFM